MGSNKISLILTINDNANYGNRLQNYALTSLISKYSNCTTIHFYKKCDTFIEFLIRPIWYNFNLIHKFLKRNANQYCNSLAGYIFSKKYIYKSYYKLTFYKGLTYNKAEHVSNIIIGSDQVWNYQWISEKDLALRLGSFVPDDIPIISYAASFGVSEVDDNVKPIFQKYLPRLKAISVREDRGAELVKEMTGLEATVVLDPTLMLDSKQWSSITRGFVPNDDRYVLTYFLGKPSDEQENTIKAYASVHGCRVRRILDLRDKETYAAGPQDFVELFSKAQYVFTDSYHACCFSILYHKQFTVFNRAGMDGKASMNSRMETLFRLFDLKSVVIDEGLAPRIDYEKVDQLLFRHRAESQAWLDKAMAGE